MSIDPDVSSDIVVHFGEEAVIKFIDALQKKAKEIFDQYIETLKPMLPLTPEEQWNFDNVVNCRICVKPLGEDRVRDHCHITGECRCPLHNECNLNYSINPKSWKLPVMMHNLKVYDGHLIVQALEKRYGRTRVIAQNMEKYMSFSVGQLQILDSMQFMEALVQTLSPEQFQHTRLGFPRPEEFELVQQKGVYPYDYFDSFEQFNETDLPPRERFYNKLTDGNITKKQYRHIQNVWNTFRCTTMRTYHNMYLKSNVLLLADVIEQFRATCMQNYGLDPVHYYTSPDLTWDAAVKMIRVNLELITDIDQYKYIENSIRGGVSMILTRYAKASNPHA